MKFFLPVLISLFIFSASNAFAGGLSKEYQQCMNGNYGNTNVIQKCIKNEFKVQNENLEKHYKKYLSNAGKFEENYKTQHKLWENKVKVNCHSNSDSAYVQIRQGKCILGMTAERSSYYEQRSRTFE